VVHEKQDFDTEGQENQVDHQKVGPVPNLFRAAEIKIEECQNTKQQTRPILGALVLPGHPVFGTMLSRLTRPAFHAGTPVQCALV
jgi:hypothetical protein